MDARALEGGFSDAALASSAAFRAALDAMARPGRILPIHGATPPHPLSIAAGTLLLTLCDQGTPVFLAPSVDLPMIRDWMIFHTGAPLSTPEDAMFALGRWEELLPLDRYAIGTSEYPDRSATLIVERDTLASAGTRLRGPGIADVAEFQLPETEPFLRNAALFPLGLDFMFTAGSELAALPRTTRVEAA